METCRVYGVYTRGSLDRQHSAFIPFFLCQTRRTYYNGLNNMLITCVYFVLASGIQSSLTKPTAFDGIILYLNVPTIGLWS